MKNQDVRLAAAGNGIKLWQIASMLNITDGNFSRKLRNELDDGEKKKIMRIISDLAKEAQND